MQLFKSEWMFEPARTAGLPDGHRPRFPARYGLRGDAVRPVCPPLPEPAELADAPALSTVEHERAVLRALARYDRAA